MVIKFLEDYMRYITKK